VAIALEETLSSKNIADSREQMRTVADPRSHRLEVERLGVRQADDHLGDHTGLTVGLVRSRLAGGDDIQMVVHATDLALSVHASIASLARDAGVEIAGRPLAGWALGARLAVYAVQVETERAAGLTRIEVWVGLRAWVTGMARRTRQAGASDRTVLTEGLVLWIGLVARSAALAHAAVDAHHRRTHR